MCVVLELRHVWTGADTASDTVPYTATARHLHIHGVVQLWLVFSDRLRHERYTVSNTFAVARRLQRQHLPLCELLSRAVSSVHDTLVGVEHVFGGV